MTTLTFLLRPLAKADEYEAGSEEEDAILDEADPCSAERSEAASEAERFLLEVTHVSSRDLAEQWDSEVGRYLLSSLAARVSESGVSEATPSQKVSLLRFRDRESLCEMRHSEVLASGERLRRKAFKDTTSYLAREIEH